MIRKILFPVDFSLSCVAMAAYVQRAAALFGAEVTMVHVCDLASHNGFELYARAPGDIAKEHLDIGRSRLQLFLASEFPEAQCARILLAGEAATLITEFAKKNHFDLILMPTHAGRFRRMLLGSTTAKVLDNSDCPVLTMLHSETIVPPSLEHKNWVCGVGSTADSERVLCYARDAALAAGAKLSAIHVVQSSEGGSNAQISSEAERKAGNSLAELRDKARLDGSVRIVVGPVKERLLDATRQSSADLLVIGRGHHAGVLGRMRDLTYSLIRDAPCPVVSV